MYEESVLMPWELEGLLKGGFASYEVCPAEASGWMGGRGRGGNEDEDVDDGRAALMASSRCFRIFSL